MSYKASMAMDLIVTVIRKDIGEVDWLGGDKQKLISFAINSDDIFTIYKHRRCCFVHYAAFIKTFYPEYVCVLTVLEERYMSFVAERFLLKSE